MSRVFETAARALPPWAAALLLLLAPAATPGQGAAADAGQKATTVFLVRHAERADEPGPDPPLSERGAARAETLARMLQSANVRAVFTSQFRRTRLTAEPLAKRLGLTPAAVPLAVKTSNPREVTEESVRELTKRIEGHAGGAVLVVGHSNSVPDVIRALGGDAVPKIDEGAYDDLFVVTVYGAGRAKVVHLKY
jgi:phosphohistidine phosphatase SixA